MKRWKEPWIADDRDIGRLDENAGVADRGCLHLVDTSDGMANSRADDATRGPMGASRFAERVKGIEPS